MCKNKKEINVFYKNGKYTCSYCKTCYAKKYFKNKEYPPVKNLLNEIWKDVVGFENLYMVSNMGRIKSLNYNNSKFEKLKVIVVQKKTGYGMVHLSKGGKSFAFLIHRLIAFNFIPNPENKPQVNHINGIKTDNRVENLEWVTSYENTIHGIKTGLIKNIEGEKNVFSVLTEKEVLEIRSLYDLFPYKYKELAKIYNVTPENISMIINRKTWKHI